MNKGTYNMFHKFQGTYRSQTWGAICPWPEDQKGHNMSPFRPKGHKKGHSLRAKP